MANIYLDQAATSFPKAPEVASEMVRYLSQIGGNPGRGSYSAVTDAEQTLLTLREQLSKQFGSPDVEACILTPGATYGINLVLHGYLQPGDHVLVSSMEHNAVMRPLNAIPGCLVEKVPCESDGSMCVAELAKRIRPQTRLICLTHASNVCGTLLPVEEVGALCAERGIAYVVDAAQTVGHIPISRVQLHADALIFPAHKGLLGPQGIGATLMSRAFAKQVRPFVSGGTGSRSNMETQPQELPDKFEAGTQNIPGIYGFLAALRYTLPAMPVHHQHMMHLCERLLEGAHALPNVRVLGKPGVEGRIPVVALDFNAMDNALVTDRLAREFGIATRCGLQCSPSAHHTLGSYPQGAVRFSIGASNTIEDIEQTLTALEVIVTDRRSFSQAD